MIAVIMAGVILLLMYINHVDGVVSRLDDEPKRKGKRCVHDDEC